LVASPNFEINNKRLLLLKSQFKKEQTACGHLRRDKIILKQQVTEATTKLKEAEKEIEDLKRERDIYKEKADKFDQIPIFRKVKPPTVGGNSLGEYPHDMWTFLCGCLATRVSVGVLMLLLSQFQRHFLPFLDDTSFQIPSDTWLNTSREEIAVASETLAAMQVAAASSVQCGLDATDMEGQDGHVSTLNFWTNCDIGGTAHMLYLAAVRPQGVGTADAEVEGVKRIMAEAQAKVKHVKKVLHKIGGTPNEKRKLPLKNGGVVISKIRSIMNDTAETAISTQVKLKAAVEKALKELGGYDDLEDQDKLVLLCRCSHHLRNLWQTESDRWSDARLKEKLGAAVADVDSNARLELRFKSYIYALLKLFRRKGRDQYAKNNSTAIRPYFEKEETLQQFPDLVMASTLGRVVGSRQDAVFETAWKTFSLLHAIPSYCADGIAEAGEKVGVILRSSICARGSCVYFMAEHFFHSVVWDLVMEPLRCIMGIEEEGQDYIALAPLFDEVYQLGKKIQEDPEYLMKLLQEDPTSDLFIFNDKWKTEKVQAWLEKRGLHLAHNVATQKKIEGKHIQEKVRKMLIDYYYDDAGWCEKDASEE